MTDRIHCCVPFCRRTTAARLLPPGHTEWMCSEHWRVVPSRLKRRRAKLHRKLAKSYIAITALRIEALDDRVWAACKRAAIEAAGGIG